MRLFPGLKSSIRQEPSVLGMSDACSTTHLFHRPSEPAAYYIEDFRIFSRHRCCCSLMKAKTLKIGSSTDLQQLDGNPGPKEGLTIRGGSSNVVGIICPPVGIGLTDLPKCEGGDPIPSLLPSSGS